MTSLEQDSADLPFLKLSMGPCRFISSFTHFMVVEEGSLGVLWRLEPFPAVLRRRRGYTQHESAAYRPVTEIDKQPFTINMELPVGLPVGLSSRRDLCSRSGSVVTLRRPC